jgi:hypothetical protein
MTMSCIRELETEYGQKRKFRIHSPINSKEDALGAKLMARDHLRGCAFSMSIDEPVRTEG